MEIEFRPMAEGDIDEIVALEEACFAMPWSRASMKGELKNRMAVYIVAVCGQRIVAYGGFWHILDEGHITNIATAPDVRRKGIGYALVERLIAEAEALGIRSLTLEVREHNVPARRLYEKCGFVRAGIRPRYYSDNGENAVIYWRT